MRTEVTTSTLPKINHPIGRHCPAWCVSHNVADAGTHDEWVSHAGAVLEVGDHSLHLERSVPVHHGDVEDTIWLDGEQLTQDQAVQLAAGLVARATQAAHK